MSVDVQDEVVTPSADEEGATASPDAAAAGARGRRLRLPALWVGERAPKELTPGWSYSRAVLTGVTLMLLGFVLLLVVGSPLQAQRDQKVLFDDLRKQLAEGVAPVGPLTSEGAVLPSGAPVAVLSVPALGRDLVVVEGTTSSDLMAGPGHRRDTVLPGQAGISILMGRQSAYGGFFGRIGTLERGAEIRVTTGQGFATYVVDAVRRAGDPQPQPLASGQARLTLISAEGTPYLAERTVRVDATLVSTSVDGQTVDRAPFPAVARVVTPATLPDAEKPMSGDTSQAVSLLLWSQLFLLSLVAITWARTRWGRWQAWVVGLPLALATGWAVADGIGALLPNLL